MWPTLLVRLQEDAEALQEIKHCRLTIQRHIVRYKYVTKILTACIIELQIA